MIHWQVIIGIAVPAFFSGFLHVSIRRLDIWSDIEDKFLMKSLNELDSLCRGRLK